MSGKKSSAFCVPLTCRPEGARPGALEVWLAEVCPGANSSHPGAAGKTTPETRHCQYRQDLRIVKNLLAFGAFSVLV